MEQGNLGLLTVLSNRHLPIEQHLYIFTFQNKISNLDHLNFSERMKMKRAISKLITGLAVVAGTVLFQMQVFAHHSVAAEFDNSITFELRGTLTGLDWANPHLWYYLDVVSETGAVEPWQCTTGTNPNRLVRAGWQKGDLPIGSKILIARANPARENSNTCIVSGGLAFDDGTPVFSGRKPE